MASIHGNKFHGNLHFFAKKLQPDILIRIVGLGSLRSEPILLEKTLQILLISAKAPGVRADSLVVFLTTVASNRSLVTKAASHAQFLKLLIAKDTRVRLQFYAKR